MVCIQMSMNIMIACLSHVHIFVVCIEHLFHHHLQSLSSQYVTLPAFKCYERFFRLINGRDGVMLYATQPTSFVVVMPPQQQQQQDEMTTEHRATSTIYTSPLRGIDWIWEVALHSDSLPVHDHATSLITLCYTRSTQRDYISRCFLTTWTRYIQDAINDKKNDIDMGRCLTIVEQVLKVENTMETTQTTSSSTTTTPTEISLTLVIFKGTTQPITIPVGSTIADLRSKVASVMDIPSAMVRMMREGRELADDTMTCVQAQVVSGGTINALRRTGELYERMLQEYQQKKAQVATTTPTTDTTATSPTLSSPPPSNPDRISSMLIHESHNYNLLFHLLDISHTISPSTTTRIWSLITSLPINYHLMNTISNIQPPKEGIIVPNFHELFPTNSMYKLLYTLRIVDDLMFNYSNNAIQAAQATATATTPATAASTAVATAATTAATTWTHNFVYAGALLHLLSLLQTFQFDNKDQEVEGGGGKSSLFYFDDGLFILSACVYAM